MFEQWIIFKNLVYSFVLEYMNFNLLLLNKRTLTKQNKKQTNKQTKQKTNIHMYKQTSKTKTKIKTNKQTKTNKRILMYQWYFERVYVQHAF